MVLDGHSDLLYDVTRRRLAGETRVLERRHRAALDAGQIEGLVLALWTERTPETFWAALPETEDAARRLDRLLRALAAELAETPWLRRVRTAAEAELVRRCGARYAFLSMEGLEPIGADLELLDRLADFGVRMATLTWNGENLLASGAACDSDQGLTDLGRTAVRRMQARGLLPDVSHLNDAGFWDVIALADGPVLASHSNCRRLCDVPRNLTDEQLRAIRDTGGMVGLNSYHGFVHAEADRQTAAALALHAAHMAEVMGPEHVACGFDFCGYMGPGNESAADLEDCSRVPDFFRELEHLGFSAAERRGIARDNLLRLL